VTIAEDAPPPASCLHTCCAQGQPKHQTDACVRQCQCRTWRERQASKPDENRGRDKQDVSRHEEGGWKATDKASNSSRDVRSRHIKSSHVTTPLPATQKMRQKGQGQTTEHNSVSTTAYQQQRINNSVSTGILTKNAFSLREHLAQNTRSGVHGRRGVGRRGEVGEPPVCRLPRGLVLSVLRYCVAWCELRLCPGILILVLPLA
jgi:hypothetical protein